MGGGGNWAGGVILILLGLAILGRLLHGGAGSSGLIATARRLGA
jgi:hypothetical protein